MQKHSIRLSAIKFSGLLGMILFLLACDGGQVSDTHAVQPGMHVYKDPVTGLFVDQPPRENEATTHKPTRAVTSPELGQEYESPTLDGGMLRDLPAPYSDKSEKQE